MKVRDFIAYCERYGLLDDEMLTGVENIDGTFDNEFYVDPTDFDIRPKEKELVICVQAY